MKVYTYVYVCKFCGDLIELEPVAPVPKCKECGEKMVRKYYPPYIHYKGNGFTGAQKEKRK